MKVYQEIRFFNKKKQLISELTIKCTNFGAYCCYIEEIKKELQKANIKYQINDTFASSHYMHYIVHIEGDLHQEIYESILDLSKMASNDDESDQEEPYDANDDGAEEPTTGPWARN